MGPPPETGIAALVLSGATIHDFAAALQGVVAVGVGAALSTPYTAAPTEKVSTLYLLHLHFICRVAEDGDLPPIWETVTRERVRMEGLTTLNQEILRGMSSCPCVF